MNNRDRASLNGRVLAAGKRLGYPPIHTQHGAIVEQGEEEWLFFVHHEAEARLQAVVNAAAAPVEGATS